MKATPMALQEDDWSVGDPAVSHESQVVRRYMEETMIHYWKPVTRRWANPYIRFHDLKTEWENQTAMLSSITDIAMNPSYQHIIGMGPVAIPLILYELEQRPTHWFWALKAITGEDPVLPQNRGKIKAMALAWLQWGKEQGYLRQAK